LLLDDTGRIWAGSNRGGLSRYDPRSDSFKRFDLPSATSSISYLVLADSNSIVAGFADDIKQPISTAIWDGVSDSMQLVELPDAPESIWRLFSDYAGRFWSIDSRGGIHQLIDKQWILRSERADASQLEVPTLDAANQLMWIPLLSGGFLELQSEGTDRVIPIEARPNSETRVLGQLGLNRYWITDIHGLHLVDVESGTRRTVGVEGSGTTLTSRTTRSVFQDQSGLIWIGTTDRGLLRAASPRQAFQAHSPPDASKRVINIFAAEGDNRLVSLFDGGMLRHNPGLDRWTQVQTGLAADVMIKSVGVGPDGALWMGSWGNGLYRMNDDSNQAIPVLVAETPGANAIRTLDILPDGRLLLGTEAGLFAGGQSGFTRLELGFGSSAAIWDTEVTQDEIWVAAYAGGVARLALPTLSVLDRLTEEDGLQSSFVTSIGHSSPDSIWVGYYGAGLDLLVTCGEAASEPCPSTFGRTVVLGQTSAVSAFDDRFVNAILPSEGGDIWFSTQSGLVQLDTAQGQTRTFSRSDGLHHDVFGVGVAAVLPDGRLAFGGNEGYSVLDPEDMVDPSWSPPLTITELTTNGTIDPERGPYRIDLPWRENELDLKVAAMDFSSTRSLQYRYRLTPSSGDWSVATSDRRVRYTNIRRGEHTLEVQAGTVDGRWFPDIMHVAIAVRPPWWWSNAARVLWALLILTAVSVAFWRAGARRSNRKLQALESRMSLQRERERISRDLHDHVGAQLNYMLATIDHSRADESPKEAALLPALETQAKESLSQLRSTIWAVNQASISTSSLHSRLLQDVDKWMRVRQDLRIRIDNQCTIDHTLSPARGLNLYRCVEEAVSNAVRHSNARTISLEMSDSAAHVSLVVSDDGEGFDQSEKQTGMGLDNMNSRMQEIGGRFELESGPSGTQVLLSVPA